VETILAIVAVALALAALVPIFFTHNVRAKTAGIAIGVSLLGIVSYQTYLRIYEIGQIDGTRDYILSHYFSSNHPMSFEQIMSEIRDTYLYRRTRKRHSAEVAVENLENEKMIHSGLVTAESPDGNKYVVRVYNSINFPIPK
jgi:hypothetical protein